MRGHSGFGTNSGCNTEVKAKGFFHRLSSAALRDLDPLKLTSDYPADAILFMEKQTPRGIYVLIEGEVKLSVTSSEGKTLILQIARPGDVLGLMAALAGSPYEVTAEALHPCKVAFVRRESFLRLLGQHPEAYQAVTDQLASQYQTACDQIRMIGLSASITARLAKLLLDWSDAARDSKTGSRTTMPLTQEEIAGMIGTTRESVTRAFSEFKRRQLVVVHGSTFMIPNRLALENCVN